MNLLNKIIEIFNPFSDSPDKFVLKNEPTWYSDRYRNILYSGNSGKSFRKLMCSKPPLFTHDDAILKFNWRIDYETFDSSHTKFSTYKEKFKSLKDIREYEEKEYKKYLEGKDDVEMRRNSYLKKLKENTL